MKHKHPLLFGSMALSALFCLTSPLAAGSQSEDKASIQSEIQKMETASNNEDADGFVAFTHPDFVNIDQTGQETTHSKQERLEKIRRFFAQASQVNGKTTVTSISFSKEGASVEKNSVFSFVTTKNGQKTVVRGNGTYRDFWVKVAGVWLQKRSRTVSETTSSNG